MRTNNWRLLILLVALAGIHPACSCGGDDDDNDDEPADDDAGDDDSSDDDGDDGEADCSDEAYDLACLWSACVDVIKESDMEECDAYCFAQDTDAAQVNEYYCVCCERVW